MVPHRAPPTRPFLSSWFDEAVRKIALQRFNSNQPSPLIFVRTGGPDDLQYEWSMTITDLLVIVYAHDTKKNRAAMNRLFSTVRRSHDGAVCASLGYGLAGVASSARLGLGIKWGVKAAFFDHDTALLAPPWRCHIGQKWLDVEGAAKVMQRLAVRQEGAKLDRDGFLFEQAPARSPTERSPEQRTAHRAFSIARKRAAGTVNRAYHDPKWRKTMRQKRAIIG
jgi:hypothetical protein